MYYNDQGSSIHLDRNFFIDNPTASSVVSLFNYLPHVVFYAKDRDSRFVAANEAMLKTKMLHDPFRLLGRTDYDFFPPSVASIHVGEDHRVINSGMPLIDQIWFAIDRFGKTRWFNSSKVPLRNMRGEVVGVTGTRYPLESKGEEMHFKDMTPVIRHLVDRYSEPTSIESLSEIIRVTPEQLNRDFVDLMGMPPHQFLHSYRIEKARQLLTYTRYDIGEIASETGFYDLDHFYRHFGRFNGVSPEEYRDRFSPEGSLRTMG